MLTSIRRLCVLLLSIQVFMGCDQPPTPTAQATPPLDSPKTVEEKPVAQDSPENQDIAAPKAPEKAPTQVRTIQFDKAVYAQDLPAGEILGGFAYADSTGENHVVFTRTEVGNEEHIHTSVLRIKHVVRNNGVVSEVRSYTERIDNCDFDVILEPKFGEWSVSDVDNNGIGEASFAYTADCISDVSPLVHKAFVTEGGQKYALRGQTYLQFPDEPAMGGDYVAEKMPPAFLQKAQQVWELTARR